MNFSFGNSTNKNEKPTFSFGGNSGSFSFGSNNAPAPSGGFSFNQGKTNEDSGFKFGNASTNTAFSFTKPAGFQAPNPAFSFSKPVANSFSKAFPQQAAKESQEEAQDEFDLTSGNDTSLDTFPGEDNEDNVFTNDACKTYVFFVGDVEDEETKQKVHKEQWEALYVGQVRVNVPKKDAPTNIKPRIVFRRDKTRKLDINALIPARDILFLEKFEVKGNFCGFKIVLVNSVTHKENAVLKPEVFIFRFKTKEECLEFEKAVLKASDAVVCDKKDNEKSEKEESKKEDEKESKEEKEEEKKEEKKEEEPKEKEEEKKEESKQESEEKKEN